jgi:hypothetical protein
VESHGGSIIDVAEEAEEKGVQKAYDIDKAVNRQKRTSHIT